VTEQKPESKTPACSQASKPGSPSTGSHIGMGVPHATTSQASYQTFLRKQVGGLNNLKNLRADQNDLPCSFIAGFWSSEYRNSHLPPWYFLLCLKQFFPLRSSDKMDDSGSVCILWPWSLLGHCKALRSSSCVTGGAHEVGPSETGKRKKDQTGRGDSWGTLASLSHQNFRAWCVPSHHSPSPFTLEPRLADATWGWELAWCQAHPTS
jgi:hypothetical protein